MSPFSGPEKGRHGDTLFIARRGTEGGLKEDKTGVLPIEEQEQEQIQPHLCTSRPARGCRRLPMATKDERG